MNDLSLKRADKAYADVFKVIEKHKDLICFNIGELASKADDHIFKIELLEKYGLSVKNNVSRRGWNKLNDFIYIGIFGESLGRNISWSDDDSQPYDYETLMYVTFPTGAFIFGEEYLENLFDDFFNELKEYGCKYCDTRNHNLYFSLDNSKEVYANFDKIFKKYKDRYRENYNQRRIEELQVELVKLQSNKDDIAS